MCNNFIWIEQAEAYWWNWLCWRLLGVSYLWVNENLLHLKFWSVVFNEGLCVLANTIETSQLFVCTQT